MSFHFIRLTVKVGLTVFLFKLYIAIKKGMKMDKAKEKFQIVDEHWQTFEDISQNESYKNLKVHANELGKTMKDAFANVLEIQKFIIDDK